MGISLAGSARAHQWPECRPSHVSCHAVEMAPFRRVAAYAPEGAVGLGLGLTSAIFRARPPLTEFEFGLCGAGPRPVSTDLGVPILLEHGPELLASSDLILLLP